MSKKVFFSYSHRDEKYRNLLVTHLKLLERKNVIDQWCDKKILAGDEIDASINEEIKNADIILFLVSSDFLASDYCYNLEMKIALERSRNNQCRVIPVILRPCNWEDAPFSHLLAIPTDGKPISTWENEDLALVDIVQHINRTIHDGQSDSLMHEKKWINSTFRQLDEFLGVAFNSAAATRSDIHFTRKVVENTVTYFLHDEDAWQGGPDAYCKIEKTKYNIIVSKPKVSGNEKTIFVAKEYDGRFRYGVSTYTLTGSSEKRYNETIEAFLAIWHSVFVRLKDY